MPNPDPYKARIAKRDRRAKALRKAGGVKDVKKKLWAGVEAASQIVTDDETEPALKLRAIHALTQASTAYTKILEATEFEARLHAVEDRLDGGSII